jgi:hypothetical protein
VEDAVEEDVVEEDAVEEDAVEEDAVEEDAVEEDEEVNIEVKKLRRFLNIIRYKLFKKIFNLNLHYNF